MTNQVEVVPTKPLLPQKIDTVFWGFLFIWIGVALLAGLGWGIGLLGVGIILLAEQVASKYTTAKLEIFWVVVGAVFVIGGIADVVGIRISLIPLTCIVAGVALLVSALFEKA